MPRVLLGLVSLTAAASAGPAQEKTAVATFAGERFWSMQADFDHVPGVISTSSGYAGGRVVANPTCAQVSDAGTGHAESVDGPTIRPKCRTSNCSLTIGTTSIRA